MPAQIRDPRKASRPREPAVELVWNKGIAALCDHRLPDEFPRSCYLHEPALAGALSSGRLPADLIADAASYGRVRDGELIWVRLSWLKSFVKQVLPLIQSRFVLVTGDSDSCVPSEVMAEARQILGSGKLLHWYAQNYDGSWGNDMISGIPIGIDFHMLCERPIWGESVASAWEQEQLVHSIRKGLPPAERRICKVYVDFAWQRGFSLTHYRTYHPLKGATITEHRWRTAKRVRKSDAVVCQGSPLSRSEMWRKRGEYAFVLSPHGMGLDCHRTWEALALGHIVLVPSSALDGLYSGLPVIPLNSWSEITAENLEKWLSLYGATAGLHEKLKSYYWIDRMRATAEAQTGSACRLEEQGDRVPDGQ